VNNSSWIIVLGFLAVLLFEGRHYYAERIRAKKPRGGAIYFEFSKLFFSAFFLATLIKTLAFQPFNIPSGSMMPNLLVGDYLFASKYSYGYGAYSFPIPVPSLSKRLGGHPPKQGDVVLFRGRDHETNFIKRVIGVAGDRVQMREGLLYLNGQLVPRKYLGVYTDPDGIPSAQTSYRYLETLPNGVEHETMEKSTSYPLADTEEFVVPEDHIFVMGDHRDDSRDSRDSGMGAVPIGWVIGKAQMVFFSTNSLANWWEIWQWPWAVRYNRLFQSIT
jgi:signal peptidase I